MSTQLSDMDIRTLVDDKYGELQPSKMTVAELRQKRRELLEAARELLDRAERFNRDLTGNEAREYDELMRRVELIARELDFRTLAAEPGDAPVGFQTLAATLGGGASARARRYLETRDGRRLPLLAPNESVRSVVRADLGPDVNPDELSLGRLIRGVVTGDWKNAKAELEAVRALGMAQGGVMVPEVLFSQVIDLARNQARVLQAGAQTVVLDESGQARVARVTGDPVAVWRSEHAAITESEPSFDAVTINAQTVAALVRVSIELLEDAANLDQLLANMLGQAIALEIDRVALRGSGTAPEPRGILNTPGINVIAADGPVNYALFSQAVQKIAEQNGEAQAAIYAPRTAYELDRLTDNTGQPLQPPRSFQNLRHYITNQVPTDLGDGSNETEIYVGDFSNLWVCFRTRARLEASRTAEDAFSKLEALIRIYARVDTVVVRPQHFAVVTGVQPAS